MEQTVIEFYQKEIDVYIGINILDDKYQNRLDKYIGIARLPKRIGNHTGI
ncbi:MAG: hypothetical protein OEL81_07265 [Nitrosopumilus sp.]|nr:hypothetical protein [Nitrosopumilus sp.]